MTKLPRGLIIAAILAVGVLVWRNMQPKQTVTEKAEAHIAYICEDDMNCTEESLAALPECLQGASYDDRRMAVKSGDALNRAAGVNLKVLDACLLMATSNMGYAADAARR